MTEDKTRQNTHAITRASEAKNPTILVVGEGFLGETNMDSDQSSLSTIIIDSNGNPIGQVIYRCPLCRKICDSSNDAMIHHQLNHHVQPQQLKRPTNSPEPITERWFHGSISGVAAEKLLLEKGINGSFLVRESQSNVGNYVLTVRTKTDSSSSDKVKQVIIRNHNNKYDVGGGKAFDSLTELVEHYKKNPMVETTGTVVNMKYPFNATRITASEIDARVKELSKENSQVSGKEGFWEEFEQLQQQECKVLFDRKIGQDESNLLKNRYKNILPYDYTRVILKRQKLSSSELNDENSKSSSDYINANFIKLVDDDTTISPKTRPLPHSKVYIATQGPLSNTVQDFWWMIWQEKSDCIVMVTKEVERGKNKCYRYWPTMEQESIISGPLEIKIMSQSTHKASDEDYIVQEFEMRYRGMDKNSVDLQIKHRVVQFQYLAWPDQNIPSSSASILNFLLDVNRYPRKGTMVVHCSAGIGRSGTLIVIDMLMDQLNVHGLSYEVDIQRIVKVTRAQRSGLVQTESQYKFIYIAIQNYIASMKHWTTNSKK